MRQFTRKQTIWSLGLDSAQAENIRSLAGLQYSLELWPEGAMPDFGNPATLAAPCMICFSLSACRQFMALPVEQTGFLDLAPKVLLLDENVDKSTMEEALDYGVSDVIRHPVTKKRFSPCLRRAAESAALQRDIQNMAHEVYIEREMLERKNEALSFLVNFLGRISESQSETELLEKAYSCLRGLFHVLTLHAVIFSKNDLGVPQAELFVAAPADSPAYAEWRERLMKADAAKAYKDCVNTTTAFLPLARNAAITARPGDGHILTLPVALGKETHCYLMLLTSMERNLSRDQALALDSALRHMAISMKNVRRYQEVCHIADRDGLTGAYNRRFFEQILLAEVARHERYGEDLSMLILDIDHFKQVNDAWGHLKGDEVLRAVVDVIMAAIRQTDYCIRYGGEEFIVLLPHTSSRNAAWLAERLRRKIQSLSFDANKQSFSITVSLGVASMAASEKKSGTALTSEADQALYHAKNEGRNRIIVYAPRTCSAMPL